ncbi:Peroxisomal-coenzyme A synthetase [Mycena sanguinolenta]|uniref:Peroxisomal-coenzyme A synthetase n=1 Tax=Mycena sanguinolenta TaxID=230812 RepID=A0A8H6Z2C6_9AGAR|nr:Peroxisomal-coenzyme A synthetase [Mycena sanguinolenta]
MSLRVDPATLDKTTRRMLSGMTPFFACTRDPRFSFAMYIPSSVGGGEDSALPLLILVHGVRRDIHVLLSGMQSFADKRGVALMAPLFPAGVGDPLGVDVHNYKAIAYRPPVAASSSDEGNGEVIRFDEILLAMVSQAARIWRLAKDGERFWIHGFSGGGQFVHRFVLLHPGRVLGASVGAPGAVVHLAHPAQSSHAKEKEEKWPKGLRDVQSVFGLTIDWPAIRTLPILRGRRRPRHRRLRDRQGRGRRQESARARKIPPRSAGGEGSGSGVERGGGYGA